MKNNQSIKLATQTEDIKEIEILATEIWSEHYLSIIGHEQIEYMLDKYQSADVISASIENGTIYYIAYNKKKPCGYCAIKINDGIFLSKFYVKRSYRGIGLGKSMLNAIYQYALDSKTNRLWLTCNKFNSKSLDIYKKLGFSIIDQVVTDIGNGFVMDDYVLEKYISEKAD